MRAGKINQIIHCSENGRVFLREITFTDQSAMVTNVEKLPPGYEWSIEAMRDPYEPVFSFDVGLSFKPGCHRCPYCGNQSVFHCHCGALSCMSSDKDVHVCPVDHKIYNVAWTTKFKATPSGLPEGGLTRLLGQGTGESIFSVQNQLAPRPWSAPSGPRFLDSFVERTPEEKNRAAEAARSIRGALRSRAIERTRSLPSPQGGGHEEMGGGEGRLHLSGGLVPESRRLPAPGPPEPPSRATPLLLPPASPSSSRPNGGSAAEGGVQGEQSLKERLRLRLQGGGPHKMGEKPEPESEVPGASLLRDFMRKRKKG